MGLGIEWGTVLAFAGGLVALYLVGWLLLAPFKLILKLIVNGIAGGILLYVLNLIGGIVGIGFVINPITALIVGFLGIPGVILLLLLKLVFGI